VKAGAKEIIHTPNKAYKHDIYIYIYTCICIYIYIYGCIHVYEYV